MFNIVLHEPEIPANTGNIGRTCLVTGSRLHLIGPLGFILNDRNLKRAGMDYWKDLDVIVYDSWRDFLEKNKDKLRPPFGTAGINSLGSLAEALPPASGLTPAGATLWLATTKARRTHSEAIFKDGDYIMFGKESAGIPEDILLENEPACVRIPMAAGQRSLNLSNSVAVVLYEALRQNDYLGLRQEGQLHEHTWPV